MYNLRTKPLILQCKCFSYKARNLSFDKSYCYRRSGHLEAPREQGWLLQLPVGTELSFTPHHSPQLSFAEVFCCRVLPPGATSPAGAGCVRHFESSVATGQYPPGRSVSFPAAYPHDKLPLPDGQLLRDSLLLTDTDWQPLK